MYEVPRMKWLVGDFGGAWFIHTERGSFMDYQLAFLKEEFRLWLLSQVVTSLWEDASKRMHISTIKTPTRAGTLMGFNKIGNKIHIYYNVFY